VGGDQILQGINAGKLQYREQSIYGAPFVRLLRREVEALVAERHGANYLMDQQTKTELARIHRELKRLKEQIAALEQQKAKLLAGRGQCSATPPPVYVGSRCDPLVSRPSCCSSPHSRAPKPCAS
jgi:hypothetical protein